MDIGLFVFILIPMVMMVLMFGFVEHLNTILIAGGSTQIVFGLIYLRSLKNAKTCETTPSTISE